jgi:hypothetical protein
MNFVHGIDRYGGQARVRIRNKRPNVYFAGVEQESAMYCLMSISEEDTPARS